jgi:hypothetical protein
MRMYRDEGGAIESLHQRNKRRGSGFAISRVEIAPGRRNREWSNLSKEYEIS